MKCIFFCCKCSIFLFISFLLIICCFYINAFFTPTIDLKTSGQLYIYDNINELVYQGSTTNEWVNIEDISEDLINAIISVEDKNFYTHNGFDYIRIASAAINNIKASGITQGASTITQQYAKNMYLTFDQTWERKIEEAFLTMELEVHYEKNDILEGYLNTIYFGNGCYGIQNASKFYFNKTVDLINFEEALILAGISKSPNAYNPLSDYDASIKRAKNVAYTMLNNQLITNEEFDNLFLDEIIIYGKHTENDLQMIMYYQDAVLNELYSIEQIPTSLIDSGGLKIYTTLDLEAQENLENNILEYKTDDEIQVASVLIEPSTGAVLALTGGMDYSSSTYNRALHSQRQVGSTMKSFLYYAALENNLTMSSVFTSEETIFHLSNEQLYSPSNYTNTYANKAITMAAAIALSDNVYAVKTNLFLGVDAMIDVARRTGITGHLDQVASLALGTSELNILDLASGYNTFASGGYYNDTYFIERIEDLNGNILYEKEHKNNLVLNENYVYILNEMLNGTFDSSFQDYTSATGVSIAHKLTNNYAYKSGSTNTDSWSIGYNEDLLMAIWMGYDNNDVTNSDISYASKNVWVDTMEDFFIDKDTSWYTKPENVIGLILDSVTGDITTDQNKASVFYYVKGSENITEIFVNENTP
ncbi:MAG: transglycosylase domain-containing protein [bacterium]